MRFKKPKKPGNKHRISAMTEAVFERYMAFNRELYSIAIEAFKEIRPSQDLQAKFISDFEEVTSLERRLFVETHGEYNFSDLAARLPGNLWLVYGAGMSKRMSNKGELTEADRQAFITEARRIQERRKNI